MSAVFSYAGGKSRAVKALDKIVRKHFPNATTLFSPFLGGASFELHCMASRSMTVYGNDLFRPLISFWQALQTQRTKLEAAIYAHGHLTKEAYTKLLNRVRRPRKRASIITEGAVFYKLVMASFSGVIGHYWPAQAQRPVLTDGKFNKAGSLANLHLSNKDVLAFLKDHPDAGMTDDSLLYVDPPYMLEHNSTLYGVSGSLHRAFDHKALRDALSQRTNWLLSYNDTPAVRKLYKGYTIQRVHWKYSLRKGAANTSNEHSNEIVILSTMRITSKKPMSKKPMSKKPMSKKPMSHNPVKRKQGSKKPMSHNPVKRKQGSKKQMSRRLVKRKRGSKKPVKRKQGSKKPMSHRLVKPKPASKTPVSRTPKMHKGGWHRRP